MRERLNIMLSAIEVNVLALIMCGGILSAVLCILDPVRDEAKKTIDSLRRLGFKNICMMTGDNKKTAASVAERLGIDHYQAEVLPEDKALYVKHMRDMGHKVIMVGDGVNDSPALSEADVGIAIDTGAAIAREIADITIASENLQSIIALREISTALMNRIKSNYRFIVGFNSALIGMGLTGVIAPSTSADGLCGFFSCRDYSPAFRDVTE